MFEVGVPGTEARDFADFWTRLHGETMETPLDLSVTHEESPARGFRFSKISCRLPGKPRASVLITVPEDTSSVRAGMVVGYGNGGRDPVDRELFKPGFLIVLLVAPRFQISAHPEIVKTLVYFHAATAAFRITVLRVFACSLFDPAVTPPGQFAVANAHPGPMRISIFLVGHFDHQYPEAEEEGRLHVRNLTKLN